MVFLVGFSNSALYFFSNPIYGVVGLTLICLFTLVRMKFQTGGWEFEKTLYDIPEVGEMVVIQKTFFWDGGFKKYINHSDPSRKPWYYRAEKGTRWAICDISDINGDWSITLEDVNTNTITIGYFESRKYWKTKSDIRNDKLRKIGI